MDRPVAIDIETPLICYDDPTPEPVCVSMDLGDTTHYKGKTAGVYLVDQTYIDDLINLLVVDNKPLVGHNIAFDLSILCIHYPELWPYVFDAYDADRIHDTYIRERLLILASNGDFYVLHSPKGKNTKLKYGLGDLEKKYLGIDRLDLKHDKDSPRFNYGKLKGVPVSEWDEESYKYSLDDSVNCLRIYYEQEKAREELITEEGIDPFLVESFRTRAHFALRLIEATGSRLDPVMVKEITEHYNKLYNDPDLIEPLIEAGLMVPGKPPTPYADGRREHEESCVHHKGHKDYKPGRAIKCDCPPKLKKGTDDTMPTKVLHKYIWSLAYQGVVDAWPSDASKDTGLANNYSVPIKDGRRYTPEFIEDTRGILPGGITLTCNEEWSTIYADRDPVLSKLATRKALRKIITDYLPKFYKEDGEPAERMRGTFFPLALTGRSSSKATDAYPSRNEQNVDPRVRPCTIPEDGNIIISTDYSGMELATLAQKCYNLFGTSVLRDKINAGVDTHAYLASQIAVNLDKGFAHSLKVHGFDIYNADIIFEAFSTCKDSSLSCESALPMTTESYKAQYEAEHDEPLIGPVTWGDFYNYYRKLAKPTGLGFPGGLGPSTMVVYAKGTYKVDLTEELATVLRNIWLKTYPEMGMYLLWVKNHCRDPHHAGIYEVVDGKKKLRQFYCYDTPLGMHRARCSFCEAANGAGLQAFAAEGALGALYEVQKAFYLATEEYWLLWGCKVINFIHDEILWECFDDGLADSRIAEVDRIMVREMEKLTPDVKARTESSAMRRWYKQAKPVYVNDKIVPWEPE